MTRMSIFQAVDNADKDGIAIEALIQAEREFMSGDYEKEYVDEKFNRMAFKDDDGYWVVTGSSKRYDTVDELMVDYPELM